MQRRAIWPTAAAALVGVLSLTGRLHIPERSPELAISAVRSGESVAPLPIVPKPAAAPAAGELPKALPRPTITFDRSTRDVESTPRSGPAAIRADANASSAPASVSAIAQITPIPVDPISRLDLPVVAPLPSAGRTIESPVGEPSGVEPPRTAPRSEGTEAVEMFGIRQALRSYEEAYERLDAAAAADVWPTVDRGALSRAFSALKSQGVDFQTCSITVNEARATARCVGTLQVVRKVGSSLPLTAEQHWLFEMRRDQTAWTIENVSTSRASAETVAQEPARNRG